MDLCNRSCVGLKKRPLLIRTGFRRGGPRQRTPFQVTMPLTLEELQGIQADAMADDLEIDFEKMSLWTTEQATACKQAIALCSHALLRISCLRPLANSTRHG